MAAKQNDAELEAILRAVPQRLIGRMLGGRQTVHLQRMADRWGFPVTGRKVDLFAVLTRLWAFLKQYGPMLQVLMEDTGEKDGETLGVQFLRAKVRKTKAEATMSELRAAEREGRLRDVRLVSQSLDLLVNRTRNAGELARRKWGEDGRLFVQELVDGFGADLRTFIDAERLKRDSADPQATDAVT